MKADQFTLEKNITTYARLLTFPPRKSIKGTQKKKKKSTNNLFRHLRKRNNVEKYWEKFHLILTRSESDVDGKDIFSEKENSCWCTRIK